MEYYYDPSWFDLDPAEVAAFESSSAEDLSHSRQSGSEPAWEKSPDVKPNGVPCENVEGEEESLVTYAYGSNLSSLCSPNPPQVFGSPKISIDEYRSMEERRKSPLLCGTSYPTPPMASLKPKDLRGAWRDSNAPGFGHPTGSCVGKENTPLPHISKSDISTGTYGGSVVNPHTYIASRPAQPLASRLRLSNWGVPEGTVKVYRQKGVEEIYPWQVVYF